MKAIRQRSGRGRRRRPATSASTRWRKCLHLRGKKQTPPSPSFVDDDSDSDSDEEEEDYQLIIKHDWAAITYLDVRSFQLWLPSTTEVRNRPVWVRWRHEIFAHYHDRRPSRLPHVHRQRSFTRVLQIHVLNIQITKFWLRCYWETFSWVFRWILQAGLYIIALYRKVASMCGDDTRVMIK